MAFSKYFFNVFLSCYIYVLTLDWSTDQALDRNVKFIILDVISTYINASVLGPHVSCRAEFIQDCGDAEESCLNNINIKHNYIELFSPNTIKYQLQISLSLRNPYNFVKYGYWMK